MTKTIVYALVLLLACQATHGVLFKSWNKQWFRRINQKMTKPPIASSSKCGGKEHSQTTWRRALGSNHRTNTKDSHYDKNALARVLFPGYFMTAEEHRVFVCKYRQSSMMPTATSKPCVWRNKNCNKNDNCSPRRGKRSSHMWHHACVASSQISKKLDYAQNLDGDKVELVQLSGYEQYFIVEEMTCDRSCGICTGHQPEPFVHQAVVWVDKNASDPVDQMDVDYIVTDGCSKCLNV